MTDLKLSKSKKTLILSAESIRRSTLIKSIERLIRDKKKSHSWTKVEELERTMKNLRWSWGQLSDEDIIREYIADKKDLPY